MATIAEAKDDIYARLKTRWELPGSATENLKLLYDSKEVRGDDVPQDEEAWGRAAVRLGPSEQVAFGDNEKRHRRSGFLMVDVFVDPGGGDVVLDNILQVLLDAFEGHTTASAGVMFKENTISDQGTMGQYEQTRFITSLEFDEVK